MSEIHFDIPSPTPGRKGDSSSDLRLRKSENRKHARFKTDEATVQLYIKGLLTSLGIGRKNAARSAVNLSEGVILLVADSKLPKGTKVQVRIEIDKFNDVIQADGVVAWCFQSARDPSYYAGISFQSLPPAQAALIGKMRSWFTSPEYKQKSQTKKRLAGPEFIPE